MIQIKPPIRYGTIDSDLLDQVIVGTKVAIVCSNSVWQKTYIKDVIESLTASHDVRLFKHLRPNAPFEDLQQVIDEFDGDKPDTIIGIGGGSVVDACKALSVCFAGESLRDLFYKKRPLPEESIHMIAVPTTAGTGAELSFGAIIFDDVDQIKGGLRGEVLQPKAVLIDVDLYKTAPKKLLAEVGFDCLTHAVETYFSIKSDPLTRYQSVSAIRTVFDFLPLAVQGDTDCLKKIAIASATMGVNLAYSSTCLPHRIQYVIGPLTGTSHAQGLVALYKGWLPLVGRDKSVSGLGQLEEDLKAGYDIIDRIQGLKEELDINYSLSTLGVRPEQVQLIAESVKGAVEFDPCYKDLRTIINVLESSL